MDAVLEHGARLYRQDIRMFMTEISPSTSRTHIRINRVFALLIESGVLCAVFLVCDVPMIPWFNFLMILVAFQLIQILLDYGVIVFDRVGTFNNVWGSMINGLAVGVSRGLPVVIQQLTCLNGTVHIPNHRRNLRLEVHVTK